MQFPECKYAKTNSIFEQWQHLRSEVLEVQVAVFDLLQVLDPESRFARAKAVTEELADVRHSAETLARVIKREFPEIDLDAVDLRTVEKNRVRDYYE